METKLTRYGPGKFDLAVDSVAYAYTGHGFASEELGESEGFCWHGLVTDSLVPLDWEPELRAELNAADFAFLERHGSAIIREDSSGFVTVEWFQGPAGALSAWERIELDFGEWSGGAE